MSTDEDAVQKLVGKAASLILKAPILTVPQAMRAANFSSAQSTNPALQMRVRRMLGVRKKNENDMSFPVEMNIDISSPMPTVSTLASTPMATAAAASLSAPSSSVSHYFVATIDIRGR